MRRVLLIAFSLLPLFAASQAVEAASPKACDLLNSQMAASLAGAPVSPPMNVGWLCFYTAGAVKAQVLFSVTNKVLDSDADSFIQAHGGQKRGPYESVPSLPGTSLFVVTSYRQNTVTVFYHEKEVNLMVRRSMTPS